MQADVWGFMLELMSPDTNPSDKATSPPSPVFGQRPSPVLGEGELHRVHFGCFFVQSGGDSVGALFGHIYDLMQPGLHSGDVHIEYLLVASHVVCTVNIKIRGKTTSRYYDASRAADTERLTIN